MTQQNDLEDENARLRSQLKILQDQVVDSCHQARSSISAASGYAKLLIRREDSLTAENHADALNKILQHIETSTEVLGKLMRQTFPNEDQNL